MNDSAKDIIRKIDSDMKSMQQDIASWEHNIKTNRRKIRELEEVKKNIEWLTKEAEVKP